MIEFHELALAEAIEAQKWYAGRSLKAARKFRSQIDQLIAEIATDPTRFPVIHDNYQYARISGFPYTVVFRRNIEQKLVVFAIAHTSRQSGYWADRT